MHVVVRKKQKTLTVLEMDGRPQNDTLKLESNIAQIILKVAYRVPNGTVEYR